MQHVFVTGANGFIGKALCRRLLAKGCHVRGGIRSIVKKDMLPHGVEAVETGSIGATLNWVSALSGVDTVIHLASRVHVNSHRVIEPDTTYRDVNFAGTRNLASSAAKQNVRRFIFISSIKVNGEGRAAPYTETDKAEPKSPYAISKYEAEQVLHDIAANTKMEVVIIRPPLVYGPGVKANFLRLMKIVSSGIPLPFAGIKNQRSLIFVENLVDSILASITHPHAAGHTFLVSDGEDISTPELVLRIATALGKPVRLYYFPPYLLNVFAKLVGQEEAANRLLTSYMVKSTKIRSKLAWTPPFSMQYGISETAKWYLSQYE